MSWFFFDWFLMLLVLNLHSLPAYFQISVLFSMLATGFMFFIPVPDRSPVTRQRKGEKCFSWFILICTSFCFSPQKDFFFNRVDFCLFCVCFNRVVFLFCALSFPFAHSLYLLGVFLICILSLFSPALSLLFARVPLPFLNFLTRPAHTTLGVNSRRANETEFLCSNGTGSARLFFIFVFISLFSVYFKLHDTNCRLVSFSASFCSPPESRSLLF